MNPYERAEALYAGDPPGTWEDLLLEHLARGFVFSTPDFFVMGRPVMHHAPKEFVVDPYYHFPVEQCDCWHFHCFAGSMAKVWAIEPWPMPWISFERKNELAFCTRARLKRLILPQGQVAVA